MEGDKESTTELWCVLDCPFWPRSRANATAQAGTRAGTRKTRWSRGQSSFREGIKPLRNSWLPTPLVAVPRRFSHVLSAFPLFFPSLNSGRAHMSKNGPRLSSSRTGPRAHHSALLSLRVHYLAKGECLKLCPTSNLKHLTSSMMESLRLTPSLLSTTINLSLARRSIIPPSVPSTAAHGAVS
jgi:hypothetical protein